MDIWSTTRRYNCHINIINVSHNSNRHNGYSLKPFGLHFGKLPRNQRTKDSRIRVGCWYFIHVCSRVLYKYMKIRLYDQSISAGSTRSSRAGFNNQVVKQLVLICLVIILFFTDGTLKTWVYGVAAGAFVLLVFVVSMSYLAWWAHLTLLARQCLYFMHVVLTKAHHHVNFIMWIS